MVGWSPFGSEVRPNRQQNWQQTNNRGWNERSRYHVELTNEIVGCTLVVAVFFAAVISGRFQLPWVYGPFLYLIVVQPTAFLLMGIDKQLAMWQWRRVPEDVFYRLAFFGAFAGIWAGRQYYRHKTTRTDFTVYLVLSAAAALFCAGGFYYMSLQQKSKSFFR